MVGVGEAGVAAGEAVVAAVDGWAFAAAESAAVVRAAECMQHRGCSRLALALTRVLSRACLPLVALILLALHAALVARVADCMRRRGTDDGCDRSGSAYSGHDQCGINRASWGSASRSPASCIRAPLAVRPALSAAPLRGCDAWRLRTGALIRVCRCSL